MTDYAQIPGGEDAWIESELALIQTIRREESGEPMMAVCQWCELAHEIEDTRVLLDLSRVCTECLDGKYGPERDGRWPA